VRTAWINLLVALAHGLEVAWLTPLDALSIAENKALQLLVARRIGIRAPATAVVSDRDRLPPDLLNPVVVKPLGPGAYRGDDQTMRVICAWSRSIGAHGAARSTLETCRSTGGAKMRHTTPSGRHLSTAMS
jgi:hypothetical protein